MNDYHIQRRLLETLVAAKQDLDEEGYTEYAQKLGELIIQFNSEYLTSLKEKGEIERK